MKKPIGIAADHGESALKERSAQDLWWGDYEVLNFGAYQQLPGDNYRDHVIPPARAMAKGEEAWGIAI